MKLHKRIHASYSDPTLFALHRLPSLVRPSHRVLYCIRDKKIQLLAANAAVAVAGFPCARNGLRRTAAAALASCRCLHYYARSARSLQQQQHRKRPTALLLLLPLNSEG